jgi:hypothetical protein
MRLAQNPGRVSFTILEAIRTPMALRFSSEDCWEGSTIRSRSEKRYGVWEWSEVLYALNATEVGGRLASPLFLGWIFNVLTVDLSGRLEPHAVQE